LPTPTFGEVRPSKAGPVRVDMPVLGIALHLAGALG
jgi:hypothetical protein